MLCRFGASERQPAGAGDGLVERGVDAAVGRRPRRAGPRRRSSAASRPRGSESSVLDDRVLVRAASRARRRRSRTRSSSSSAARGRARRTAPRAAACVELTLNSLPAVDPGSARRARLHSADEPVVQRAQLGDVDADADALHAGQHPDERVLDRRRRACAGPARRAPAGERRSQPCRRRARRAAAIVRSSMPLAVEVELRPSAARRGRRSSSPA